MDRRIWVVSFLGAVAAIITPWFAGSSASRLDIALASIPDGEALGAEVISTIERWSDSSSSLSEPVEAGPFFATLRALVLEALCEAAGERRSTGPRPEALLEACRNEQILLARALLEEGADVHARDDRGWSSLHFAAWAETPQLIELLLSYGADPWATDEDGWSVLLVATDDGPAVNVRRLLELGVDPNESTGEAPLPLNVAASESRFEALEVLLDAGADARARGPRDRTALHEAANGSDPRIARRLVEGGAGLEAVDDDGMTPLLECAARGNLVMLRTLHELGASLRAVDARSSTCLHVAARGGHVAVIQLLLELGLERSACDASGKTALMVALDHRRNEVVDFLWQPEESPRELSSADEAVLHSYLVTCFAARCLPYDGRKLRALVEDPPLAASVGTHLPDSVTLVTREPEHDRCTSEVCGERTRFITWRFCPPWRRDNGSWEARFWVVDNCSREAPRGAYCGIGNSLEFTLRRMEGRWIARYYRDYGDTDFELVPQR